MTEENLKKLIKQLQYKSSPEIKERMRTSIDRAWNQQTPAQAPQEDLPYWRIIMNSPKTKFAIAAVLIIAVVLGIFPIINKTAPPTFAQVASYLIKAETAIMTIVIGQPGEAPEIHDMIMGNRIRRSVTGIQESVSIIDLETSKILALVPQSKTAVYVELENLPEIPNYMERLRNVVTFLEESKDVQIDYLGEHDLDGQEVLGFKASWPDGELYVWADPVTYAPVQIDQYEGQLTIICKDMQFDVPMDESLFSMEPPEGYTIQKTQLDLNAGTEENFIKGLKLWAEYIGDGYFTNDVSVEAFVKNAPMMGMKLDAAGLTDAEAMAIGMAIGEHIMFIRFYKGEGLWYYNGKDVQYGDGEIPIFWYKPKDSPTWRVIYGDLRVEDVAEEDLPTIMTDQERAANKQKYPAPEITEFIGIEKATWYIQPGGRIEVHSELTILARPEGNESLSVRLPYENGTLQQVAINQTEWPFEEGEQSGTYTIPLPDDQTDTLACIWSISLEDLSPTDYGYEVRLRSLLKANAYQLEVVLELGCGFVREDPAETSFVPFTIGFQAWGDPFCDPEKATDTFGTCGLAIQKIAP